MEHPRGDNRTIQTSAGGILTTLRRPGSSPGGGGPSAYSGPFKVVKNTDTSVIVQGNNASEGRNWYNEVIIGSANFQIPESTVTDITSSGFLSIKLEWDSGTTYTHSFTKGTTHVSQGASYVVIPLAWIDCEDSKITAVTQIFKEGVIFIPGRFVL
jgi:hypothetical protein